VVDRQVSVGELEDIGRFSLDHEFGHWVSPVGCFQRPKPPQLLLKGLDSYSPKGFSPSLTKRSLQAVSSAM